MKIIQIIFYPGEGGAEQCAYLLAKEAIKAGNQIIFVFSEEGPFIKRVEKLGCKVYRIKMRSPFDPLAIKELADLFKKEKPDIVQTHFLRENFLAIAASKYVPVAGVFSTVHRVEPKTLIQAKFNKLYSTGLTKFIAVSPIVKDYLADEGIKASKIVLVPNGVEIGKFDKNKIRREVGLTEKEKVVSCIARFTEEKGQEYLIKAFSKIRDKKTKLVLVGSGEKLEKAKKLADKIAAGRVIFTGGRDRGFEIIGISDLYVQPSRVETFGLSVVEAMMLKVPVLVSNIPAFQYLVNNEENGELFPLKKPTILTEKIDRMLGENSNTKTSNAYKFVMTRFTSTIMWARTERLYQHAIDLAALKNKTKGV